MKIDIYFDANSSAPVALAIELTQQGSKIIHLPFTVDSTNRHAQLEYDFPINCECQLSISRNDARLYATDRTHHEDVAYVTRIVIDEFWEFGSKNHWSNTYYSEAYRRHLANKSVTWELSQTQYNNAMYFNGCLTYDISTPIRGMFFK